MTVRINTIAFQGVDVQTIDVQAQISHDPTIFKIIGNI